MLLTFFLESEFIIAFIAFSVVAVLVTLKFANLKGHKRFRPAIGNVIGCFVLLMVLSFFISWGVVALMSGGTDKLMDGKKEMKKM